jgi:hypothetical protein
VETPEAPFRQGGQAHVPRRDRAARSCDDVGDAGVERALDLVLDQQLALLEPRHFEIVRTELRAQYLDLFVEPAVLGLQRFETELRFVVVHRAFLAD